MKILKYIMLMLSVMLAVSFTGCSKINETKEKGKFEAYCEFINQEDIKNENGIYYADSRVLLTAKNTVEYEEVESLIKKLGGEIRGYISVTNDFQIYFPDGKTYQELENIVKNLQEDSIIEDAYLCYMAEIDNASVTYTNDPWVDVNDKSDSSGREWDEKNPGGKNWWAEAIGMPSVWDMDIEFQPVKVGIIDSMFDITHKDLDNGLFVKLWNNPQDDDGICNVSQIYKDTKKEFQKFKLGEAKKIAETNFANSSHGTHVSGIIAAEIDNNKGIAGISQNSQLYGYAIATEEISASGDLKWGDIFMLKVAIADLLNEGVKIINVSQGYTNELKGTQDGDKSSIEFTSVNSRTLESFLLKYIQKGYEFLIVKVAGNESTDKKKYDAAYDLFGYISNTEVADRIIMVGAAELKKSGYRVAEFSNIGDRIDVYAPGVDILSDVPTNAAEVHDGTSMSAPIVTGIASLIWGINPKLSAKQVRDILTVPTSSLTFSPANKSNFQSDDNTTAIINAKECVELARNTVGTGKVADTEYGTLNGMIYALSADDYYEDFQVKSLTVYNNKGDKVSTISIYDIIATYEDTGNVVSLHTYTELLKPGNYTLKVIADGYEPMCLEVTINKGDVKKLDFKLVKSETSGEGTSEESKEKNNEGAEVLKTMLTSCYWENINATWFEVYKFEMDGTWTRYYVNGPEEWNPEMKSYQEGFDEGTYQLDGDDFILNDNYTEIDLVNVNSAEDHLDWPGWDSTQYWLKRCNYSGEVFYEYNGDEIYDLDICLVPFPFEGEVMSLDVNVFPFWEINETFNVENPLIHQLTDQELENVKKELGVPEELKVEIIQEEPYWWDAGGRWLINVSIYDKGELIANVSVDAKKTDFCRNIMMYSD